MRVVLLVFSLLVVAVGACSEKAAPAQQLSGSTVTVPGVAADGTATTAAATPAVDDSPSGTPVAHGIANSGCTGPALTAGSVSARTYLATFDGKPPGPLSACGLADWDIQVHSRNADTWQELEAMESQHGADCSPPPATHPNSMYEQAAFLCRDHLMTALNASGYGVIYLSPDQALDLTAGEAVIRFDVSTLALSDRDWWDIWITPFEDYVPLPLDSWLPDLQGEPRNALHLRTPDSDGPLCPELWIDGAQRWERADAGCDQNPGIRTLLTPSATVRTPFEVRLSRTHIRVCMVTPSFCWIDHDIPALSWTYAVVQFGHHSYSPEKSETRAGMPNTWHWDNISLSPVREFTIIKADRRYVDENGQSVHFAAPAPEAAYLRFSAMGKVEIDDGTGWRVATPSLPTQHNEHANSYFLPVPEGTTTVSFRFSNDDWYSGPFIAKDFAIWSPPR